MNLRRLKLEYIREIHVEARKPFSALGEISALVKEQSCFTSESLLHYLMIKPLLVIEVKNEEFHLVAGYREWLLAQDLLEQSKSVQCMVLHKRDLVNIDELAWLDIYSSLLIFSAHPKRFGLQLARLVRQLPNKIKEKHYSDIGNIKQLSKATHISRNAFYKEKQDENQKHVERSTNRNKVQIDSYEELMGGD